MLKFKCRQDIFTIPVTTKQPNKLSTVNLQHYNWQKQTIDWKEIICTSLLVICVCVSFFILLTLF